MESDGFLAARSHEHDQWQWRALPDCGCVEEPHREEH